MQKTILSLCSAIFAIFFLTAALDHAAPDNHLYRISMVIRDGDKIVDRPNIIVRNGDDGRFTLNYPNYPVMKMKTNVHAVSGKAHVRWKMDVVTGKHRPLVMQENMVLPFDRNVVIVGSVPRNSLSYNRDFTITMKVDYK